MTDTVENNTQWYMLTVVGEDKPGIVAALTDSLYRGGCNLGEASMIRLGGNFTIMMMVGSSLELDDLRNLVLVVSEKMGLHVHVDRIEARLHEHKEPNVQISVYGADRAGIVAEVTGGLSRAGLNILDLNSDVGGTEEKPVYVMMIDGYIADGVEKIEPLLAELKNKGIEATLTPLDTLVG